MTWFGKPGQSAPAADSPPHVHDPPAAHDPPDRRPPAPTTDLIVPDAPPTGGDLVPLAAVELALANAERVGDVKEIRDKAEAVRTYAERAGLGLEQQNAAAEVRLRAERRAGEMLAKMALHGGDRRGADAPDRVTLGDLGVSKDQSARWQKLARVTAGDFDAHVAAVKGRGEELTTAGLLRLAKPARKRAAKAEPADEDAPDAGVVETLAELIDSGAKFGCLYADPPWPGEESGDDAPTIGQLSALRLDLLAADVCQLHLWTTNEYLPTAVNMLAGWGFEYAGTFAWCRPTGTPGRPWRSGHDLLVCGLRGGCPKPGKTALSWLTAGKARGGGKPAKMRKLLEEVTPGPRAELFTIRATPGWTCCRVAECG